MKHFLSIADCTKKELLELINIAVAIKKKPKRYHNRLYEKTLMTFFQAPSLRTEVSFDVAMFEMGGEVIDYHAETSPWAKGKESLSDVAKVISRYCSAVMMRMPDHAALLKFAKNASIPVINGLTTVEHPCQVVGDFLTILEVKKRLLGLTLVYLGDAKNNVTHSLLLGCALLGMHIVICCPKNAKFSPSPAIFKKAQEYASESKSTVALVHDPQKAVEDADIIYTDSWMSYHVPNSEKKKRIKILQPFQVNKELMSHAKSNTIFMHCLPAKRGEEVTKGVIDGKQSIVFDQAENRLYTEKAILLKLIQDPEQ